MRSNARVKLSRKAMTDGLGGKRRNRQPRIEGTITSPSPLWDGRTNPEGWHVDFLEKISAANVR